MGQDRAWRGWSLALNASILASAARRTPRRVLAPTYPCDRVCVVFGFFTLVCLRVSESESERDRETRLLLRSLPISGKKGEPLVWGPPWGLTCAVSIIPPTICGFHILPTAIRACNPEMDRNKFLARHEVRHRIPSACYLGDCTLFRWDCFQKV